MINPSRFYTYAYLREDRTPYYIGKGSGKRVYKKCRREIKPPKDKSRIIFLKQNLTEDEAFKHEIYMISVFGRKDLGTGILHNRTNGGEGPSGRIVTQQQIMKHRKIGKKCVENKIGLHGCDKEIVRLGRIKGSMKSKETLSRTFKVKDLSGNIVEGKNVTEFCRKYGYSPGNFLQMLYGKQNIAYGYVLPETKITCYIINSPKGIEYTISNFDNFSKFCKQHNLNNRAFIKMLNGGAPHRKWKLLSIFYR